MYRMYILCTSLWVHILLRCIYCIGKDNWFPIHEVCKCWENIIIIMQFIRCTSFGQRNATGSVSCWGSLTPRTLRFVTVWPTCVAFMNSWVGGESVWREEREVILLWKSYCCSQQNCHRRICVFKLQLKANTPFSKRWHAQIIWAHTFLVIMTAHTMVCICRYVLA